MCHDAAYDRSQKQILRFALLRMTATSKCHRERSEGSAFFDASDEVGC
jgi:hypothetical protein